MVIMKCTDVFRRTFSRWGGMGVGKGGGVTWEDLFMEEFFVREDNFYEGAQDFSALFKEKQ